MVLAEWVKIGVVVDQVGRDHRDWCGFCQVGQDWRGVDLATVRW